MEFNNLKFLLKVAASGNEDEVIDLEFVYSLVTSGASVHATYRHGQSVLHEAARDWDLGIAEFLVDNGKTAYLFWLRTTRFSSFHPFACSLNISIHSAVVNLRE